MPIADDTKPSRKRAATSAAESSRSPRPPRSSRTAPIILDDDSDPSEGTVDIREVRGELRRARNALEMAIVGVDRALGHLKG